MLGPCGRSDITLSVSVVAGYMSPSTPSHSVDPHAVNVDPVIRLPVWSYLMQLLCQFAPPKTTHAYQNVWTEEGSPFIVNGNNLGEFRQKNHGMHIELGMCYAPALKVLLSNLSMLVSYTSKFFHLFPQ
eukprot:6349709-Amphidinium_carterae.2